MKTAIKIVFIEKNTKISIHNFKLSVKSNIILNTIIIIQKVLT
jgi:hypothetical protein